MDALPRWRPSTTTVCLVAVVVAAGHACGRNRAPPQLQTIEIDKAAIGWLSPMNDYLWGVRDVLRVDNTTWALTSVQPFLHGFRDGARVSTFGSSGLGPHEMRSPIRLMRGFQAGEVAVWDPGSGRYLSFSLSEPKLTTKASLPSERHFIRPDIAVVTFGNPHRTFSGHNYFVRARYKDRVIRGADFWGGQLYERGLGGDHTAVWLTFDRLPGATEKDKTDRVLGPVPIWDGCPDGRVAVLDPIAARLYSFRSNWEERDSVSLTWASRPLTIADRLGYLTAQLRHEVGETTLHPDEVRRMVERVERQARDRFAVEAPLGVDLKCGPSRVWIQEYDGSAHPLGFGPTWRTISLNGGPYPFVRVTLPLDFTLFRVLATEIVGVVTDADGFQRLATIALPSPLRNEQ